MNVLNTSISQWLPCSALHKPSGWWIHKIFFSRKSCQLLSTDTQWSLEWALPGCMEGVGEAWLCGTCHVLRAVSYVPCTLARWPMTRPNTSKHFWSYSFKYINSYTLYWVLYRCEYYTCIYMCTPLDIYYVLIYYASITCWCNLFGFQ